MPVRRIGSLLLGLVLLGWAVAPAEAVTLVAPSDGAVFPNPSPTLRWKLDRGEKVLRVFVFRVDGSVAYDTNEWRDEPTNAETSYDLNEMLPPATYTWTVTVTNVFGEKVTSDSRTFTTNPPRLQAFTVKTTPDRAKRVTRFAAFQSPGWAEIVREVYWRGKRVNVLYYYPFREARAPLDDPYAWSCKRPGLHGFRVIASDVYGTRILRRGTFTVPRCRS